MKLETRIQSLVKEEPEKMDMIMEENLNIVTFEKVAM
jgi:hypothetical protein